MDCLDLSISERNLFQPRARAPVDDAHSNISAGIQALSHGKSLEGGRRLATLGRPCLERVPQANEASAHRMARRRGQPSCAATPSPRAAVSAPAPAASWPRLPGLSHLGRVRSPDRSTNTSAPPRGAVRKSEATGHISTGASTRGAMSGVWLAWWKASSTRTRPVISDSCASPSSVSDPSMMGAACWLSRRKAYTARSIHDAPWPQSRAGAALVR